MIWISIRGIGMERTKDGEDKLTDDLEFTDNGVVQACERLKQWSEDAEDSDADWASSTSLVLYWQVPT